MVNTPVQLDNGRELTTEIPPFSLINNPYLKLNKPEIQGIECLNNAIYK